MGAVLFSIPSLWELGPKGSIPRNRKKEMRCAWCNEKLPRRMPCRYIRHASGDLKPTCNDRCAYQFLERHRDRTDVCAYPIKMKLPWAAVIALGGKLVHMTTMVSGRPDGQSRPIEESTVVWVTRELRQAIENGQIPLSLPGRSIAKWRPLR